MITLLPRLVAEAMQYTLYRCCIASSSPRHSSLLQRQRSNSFTRGKEGPSARYSTAPDYSTLTSLALEAAYSPADWRTDSCAAPFTSMHLRRASILQHLIDGKQQPTVRLMSGRLRDKGRQPELVEWHDIQLSTWQCGQTLPCHQLSIAACAVSRHAPIGTSAML